MRTYYGYSPMNVRGQEVMVRYKTLQKLPHHVRHADSFTWGYGGSGPRELARCILLDAFGISSCPDNPNECRCTSKWVEPAFAAFAENFLAKYSEDEDWKISQRDVVDWVFDFLASDRIEDIVDDPDLFLEPVQVS